jgi:hypothetical protein
MTNEQMTAADTDGGAGWSDVSQAARAQIAPDPKWPLEKFRADLQAIQSQLRGDERILDIRTLHQGGPGRATGAIAVTTQRLIVVDLTRSSTPVAETVLFSEVKGVSCFRRGFFGMSLTVRTNRGRRIRGLESKDRASAKRFVAALQAQIESPSPTHLHEVPQGSVAVKPPTILARAQRAFQLGEYILAPVFPVAAVLVITGTTSNQLTQLVVGVIALLRALDEVANALVVRLRSGGPAPDPNTLPAAVNIGAAE